jgi:hypothetical protein
MENTVISHYPVLESLVAFAILFLLGFLLGKSNRSNNTVAPKQGVALT